MTLKKINPYKSYSDKELVKEINVLSISLEKFISAINSRLSKIDDNLEALQKDKVIKAPKIKCPLFIVKERLPDGTLALATWDTCNDYDSLLDSLDEDDDAQGKNFAIYKFEITHKV